MAFSLPELLLSTLVLLVPLYFIVKSKRPNNPLLPTDWPIVGMLPALIANGHNILDYADTILVASDHNFEVRGPPATSVRFFVTCDPANVRHIFTTNFDNFPKGEEFAEVSGVLAGTIVATDGESWRRQRARIQYELTRPQLLASLFLCCRDKVGEGLVHLLTRMASTRTLVDMDELLGRLVFDMTIMIVFGWDTCYLSADMPPMHLAAALDALLGVSMYRQSVPVSCWKMMRWLNVGWERKLAAAEAVLRNFVAENIRRRMAGRHTDNETATMDMLSYYINDPDYFNDGGEPTDFLHRTFINFMVAFRDTVGAALPWLVYNIATNPHVVSTIRKELAPIVARKSATAAGSATVIFEPEETKGLVYQRAALFESLRLYPAVPIERKEVLTDDVLPSGHKVLSGDTIIIPFYSMGRLAGVWGEDCREYRPERWLSDDGGKLRYVPSYKFVSFNTGPRSCLGKNIAVALITSIVATVMWNFDVEVLERNAVKPKLSAVLQMKNGLMMKVKKREERNP